jgi:hypothetical protein
MSDGTRPIAALGSATAARPSQECPSYVPSDFALRRDSAYR